MEHEEIKSFVADTELGDDVRTRVMTLIEHGPPEIMIRNYVVEKHADLTVIGTIGRGMLFHLLIGGHARGSSMEHQATFSSSVRLLKNKSQSG